jgi:hypothetical protein
MREERKWEMSNIVEQLTPNPVNHNNANRIAQEFRKGSLPYEFAWIALEWRFLEE